MDCILISHFEREYTYEKNECRCDDRFYIVSVYDSDRNRYERGIGYDWRIFQYTVYDRYVRRRIFCGYDHYGFFQGLDLLLDGSSPELVKDILEIDMLHQLERNSKQIRFWQDLGGYAPAWGMVGTLIGLINMLKFMGTNPSSVGEGMALALITTLYGSVMANWVCIPVSRKLEESSKQEELLMEMSIEGVLSIQMGENPHIIREKLCAFREKQ